MTPTRIAYLPLTTHPDTIADEKIAAAAKFATALGCRLQVTTFAVQVPRISSPLGNLLLDIPELARAAEENSLANSSRLKGLVQGAVGPDHLHYVSRGVAPAAVPDAAAEEARYFDLAVLPWCDPTEAEQDLSQAVVFGSGRPTLLVPVTASPGKLDKLAIAWDGSRVAARALGDALPLLADGGSIAVLTVQDEKPLGPDLAEALSSALRQRGWSATPVKISLGKRTIAAALQEAAVSEGAQVLAMGGFGHSRVRDFVLGGATKGVLAQLRLPALLSH